MRARSLVPVFVATSLLASGLLFLVQPIAARELLPRLGGSPAVWNTSMVFFQTTLLAGYYLAHRVSRLRSHVSGRGVLAAVALGAVLTLPIGLSDGWVAPTAGSQAWWTLAALSVSVGMPFFLLSALSPTLQMWFSQTLHAEADDPYFLYAAGNIGSAVALIAYPLLIEPQVGVRGQARGWSLGFVALVLLVGWCGWLTRGRDPTAALAGERPATSLRRSVVAPARRLAWVGLAFVPSALLLGVTQHIATDVASFPLLWLIPLTLYLVTYVVAFSRPSPRVTSGSGRAARLLVIPAALTLGGVPVSLWVQVALHLALFFSMALAAHARLAADRPPTDYLTGFYLHVSVGGALGGVFAGLVAPLAFNDVYEYPIVLALGLALLPRVHQAPAWLRGSGARAAAWAAFAALVLAGGVLYTGDADVQVARLVLAFAGVVAFVVAARPQLFAAAMLAVFAVAFVATPGSELYAERTFFGVNRVVREADGRMVLMHGTTLHGFEVGRDGRPTAYYAPSGPAGTYLAEALDSGPASVGVVGLGTGALAAYGARDDAFTFYEIDQAVVDIASNPAFFTFLETAEADVVIRLGDGRRSLEALRPRHDILVIDAFSSDAIPVHLMTQEAVTRYLDVVGDGTVLLHVTNRHLELVPTLAAIADSLGVEGAVWRYRPSPGDREAGATASDWVALGTVPTGWANLADEPKGPRWTDDYSNLISVLR